MSKKPSGKLLHNINERFVRLIGIRLNFQHGVLFKLTDGQLLHPSIDKSQVTKIADVGTGTW